MSNYKRYGVIIERKEKQEDKGWATLGIKYFSSFKKALEYSKSVDMNKNNIRLAYRVYGIFDYQKVVYKYIIKEEER